MSRTKPKKSKSSLYTITRKLARITNRKAQHARKTGKVGVTCSYIIAGYVGSIPYLTTVKVDGKNDPHIEVLCDLKGYSVIGSGEAERAACRQTLARGFEGFTDEQAVWVLGSMVDGAMSIKILPQRFDEGIGDLKLHFVINKEGWKFIPCHVEMFRGRIADRNKPLGHAPVHSVIWNGVINRFQLQEHQTGSLFPLASVLSLKPYDLRGKVKADFDPYTLKT